MADVIDQAVTDRERPLRDDVVVPFRTGYLRLRAEDTQRIVRSAQRRFRRHNAARRWVEGEIWSSMAATWRDGVVSAREVRDAVRTMPEIRAALERMWPLLAPAELLHDLFGSKALLKLAAAKHLQEHEYLSLYRPRLEDVSLVRWTDNDVALLDEARNYLGSKPVRNPAQNGQDPDEIRTYGHIVVDEVQDLTPMQLRMVSRRSLNGSMTVVGDIAQATGALAPNDWADVLAPSPRSEAVTGDRSQRRLPHPGPDHGACQPGHAGGDPDLCGPRRAFARATTCRSSCIQTPTACWAMSPAATRSLADDITDGTIAVVAPDSMVDSVSQALVLAGIEHGRATRTGLEQGVTVVPVSVVKGLELDGVVVVEPATIVEEEVQGLRAPLRCAHAQHPPSHRRALPRTASCYAPARYACTSAVRLR